jgi:predicted Zn-dependent protease
MRNNQKGFAGVLLVIILAFVIGVGLFIFYANNKCRQVKTFSIGNIDPRFNVSKSDVKKVADDAATRWNNQTGDDLLKYDENAKLKINLVYDDRQAEVDKFNVAVANLQKNRQTVEGSNKNFNSLLTQYQSDLDAYNQEVSSWNSRGGAPADVYTKLQKTKSELDQRRQDLVAIAQTVNIQVEGFNTNLTDLQKEIDSRKNIIITQGIYDPKQNEIEIYTFGNLSELRLVLMHELGHALGLDHDQDKYSIMYYLLADQDLSDPELSSEDITMVKTRCDLNNPSFFRNLFQILAPTTN